MKKIPPRNLAALWGLAISLQPKSAQDYVQQTTVLLHVNSQGSTWETPSLNGVLNPERLLRAGTAWESGSWGEQVPVPAYPHPQGDRQIQSVAVHAPLGQGVLKPGVLTLDGRQGPGTRHIPHAVPPRPLPTGPLLP